MVTLKTISEYTGFSLSVVSRALNPRPDQKVAASTKLKVELAVEQLNYRRNHSASILARGKSTALGVFLPDYPDSLIADLVIGITEKASERDFICNFYFGLNNHDYLKFMSSVEGVGSSGILSYMPHGDFSSTELALAMKNYRKRGGRILFMNTPVDLGLTFNSLNIDNFHGGELAAECLLARDCSEYICISASLDSWQSEQRRAGFAAFLDKRNLIPKICYASAQAGYQNFSLPDLKKMFSLSGAGRIGIFCSSDYIAIEIISCLSRLGLGTAIGEKYLLVGYDDLPVSRHIYPSLTTIRQPFRELGRCSVDYIINLITNSTLPAPPLPLPELVKRESA